MIITQSFKNLQRKFILSAFSSSAAITQSFLELQRNSFLLAFNSYAVITQFSKNLQRKFILSAFNSSAVITQLFVHNILETESFQRTVTTHINLFLDILLNRSLCSLFISSAGEGTAFSMRRMRLNFNPTFFMISFISVLSSPYSVNMISPEVALYILAEAA